jgi:hypothetical protein
VPVPSEISPVRLGKVLIHRVLTKPYHQRRRQQTRSDCAATPHFVQRLFHARTSGGFEIFNVQICDRGAVHFTAGFVTLRLEPSAYRELADVVNEGLLRLTAEIAPTLN